MSPRRVPPSAAVSLAVLVELLGEPRARASVSGVGALLVRGMRWYAWSDLATTLGRKRVLALRRKARASRMRTRTSRQWVAGWPRLVAEWHPTKNGDLFPDQVSFGSSRRV